MFQGKKLALSTVVAAALFALSVPASAGLPESIYRVDPEYREAAAGMVATYTTLEQVESFNRNNPGLLRFAENERPDSITSCKSYDGYEVEISLYLPQDLRPDEKVPMIFYTPGGGYLFRIAYYNALKYRLLSDELRVAVAVPRYRLSQEKAFPAALEDSYAALLDLHDRADSFKIDSDNIIVAGESAGGGLAASLALLNRDRNALPLKGQVLIAPMLDKNTGKPGTYPPHTGEIVWDAPSNIFAWQMYAGKGDVSETYMSYFSPAQAEDLSDLPPAFIYTGDLDLFAAEDIRYALKLLEQGNTAELHLIPGLFHLFDLANPAAEKTLRFKEDMYRFIKEHFAQENN